MVVQWQKLVLARFVSVSLILVDLDAVDSFTVCDSLDLQMALWCDTKRHILDICWQRALWNDDKHSAIASLRLARSTKIKNEKFHRLYSQFKLSSLPSRNPVSKSNLLILVPEESVERHWGRGVFNILVSKSALHSLLWEHRRNIIFQISACCH